MNDDYNMSYLGEEDSYWKEVAERQEAYYKKWPNACRSCGGWGMHFIPGKFSGPPEDCYPDEVDMCDKLDDDQCHRCGAHDVVMKVVAGYETLVCKSCGWMSGEDGCPQG